MAERRGWLWSLLAAAAVLVLGIRALLPWALQHVVVHQAAEALDARVELANVDLSILGGEVALEGLRIAAADAPEETRLAADWIVLRLDRAALYQGRLGLGSLSFEGPELLLDRNGDALSLGDEVQFELSGFIATEDRARVLDVTSQVVLGVLVAWDRIILG